MARMMERLTALSVTRLGPGLHADGGGLYLSVNAHGARSWIFRYMLHGHAREMGLGPLHTIGLSEARKRAGQARQQKLDGVDPLAARDARRTERQREQARSLPFKDCARDYIQSHRAGWKNPVHALQWSRTLEAYAYPVIGALPAAAITVEHVLRILQPIWSAKPETAGRVRGRVEAVIDYAIAKGYRDRQLHGDNPARWKGLLDQLLPALAKAKRAKREVTGRPKHQPAMPYGEIGEFMPRLRARDAVASHALDFTILTAMRTETVIGARAREIDFTAKVWTIPAGRPGLKHRDEDFKVPLSDAAIGVLERMAVDPKGDPDRFLFPGKPGQGVNTGLSNAAMRKCLQEDLGCPQYTVHGFRSTFRDWARSVVARFPEVLAEIALAHTVGTKVERAYARDEALDQRHPLMEAWAKFCAAPARGQVVAIRRAG